MGHFYLPCMRYVGAQYYVLLACISVPGPHALSPILVFYRFERYGRST